MKKTPLHSLAKVRELATRSAEIALVEARQAERFISSKITTMQGELRAEEPLAAPEFYGHWMNHQLNRISHAKTTLRRAEVISEAARVKLVGAKRDEKVLGTIMEKREAVERKIAARHAQMKLDEAAQAMSFGRA